jgi:DNA-binding MarR family transcriptional regulator
MPYVTAVDPADLDLTTLAMLAGAAAAGQVQAVLESRGFAGLRISHGYVFQHLLGSPPTIGELAGKLEMTQQGASKVVAELTGLGYLDRVTEAGDARVRRVTLSLRGKAAVEAARQARRDIESQLMATCGAGRLRTARRVLLSALDDLGGLEAVRRRRVPLPT